MEETSTALMKLEGFREKPSLEDAANYLDLPLERLDESFGVVLISPTRRLYAVRVFGVDQSEDFDPARGPYADPRIEPMGEDD